MLLKHKYDIVIAGAGCAGLSLLLRLIRYKNFPQTTRSLSVSPFCLLVRIELHEFSFHCFKHAEQLGNLYQQ